jgi:hypothetical protein
MTGDDARRADNELDDGVDAELDAVDRADDDEDDLDDGEGRARAARRRRDIPGHGGAARGHRGPRRAREVVAGPGSTTYQLAERPFAGP